MKEKDILGNTVTHLLSKLRKVWEVGAIIEHSNEC